MKEGEMVRENKELVKPEKGYCEKKLTEIENYLKRQLESFREGERLEIEEDFLMPIYEALEEIKDLKSLIINRHDKFIKVQENSGNFNSDEIEKLKKELDQSFKKRFQIIVEEWTPFVNAVESILGERVI
jgi:ribosome recycling factor